MAGTNSETSKDNKIEYGLRNVYYALIESYDVNTQKYTYGTPVPIPGAVSVSFSASGDSSPFYADNIVYYNVQTNAGYEGDLEIALIPDSFRTDILGEKEIDGMLAEISDATGKEFALMFQLRETPAANVMLCIAALPRDRTLPPRPRRTTPLPTPARLLLPAWQGKTTIISSPLCLRRRTRPVTITGLQRFRSLRRRRRLRDLLSLNMLYQDPAYGR